ncbi:hypothetical protein DES53_101112 [Roseimicrobium gellanilyticum]|uniref:Uncharacterized protein n=1 Tax=Roseimicrobium gellanilyticum TaxID=748857 RepID=A0A366HUY9_9BACT|nr:hypothetical protein [Roseimicrobium gellanilyticum]RBP47315.1 hypothetical protein DES53_101112 [Roseimicrobium gellanilyticum]
MTRRARRITIALFLILLAIPLTYLVLSWRPEDSLEFQASAFWPNPTSGEGEPSTGTTNPQGTIDVLVANKGYFPIRFYYGYLELVGDADPASVVLQHSAPIEDPYIVIPPGKFIRARSGTWDSRGHADGGIRSPGINVRYFWLSALRAQVDDWLGWWYYKRNPNSLRFPKFHTGHAHLIPPPDSATVEP